MLLNKDEIVNAITQTLPISKQTQQIIDYLYSEEEAEKEKENILSNNITSYLLDYFQVHSLQKEFPFELDEIESDCFSPSKSIDDGEKENIVILKNPHDFENSIGEKIESILTIIVLVCLCVLAWASVVVWRNTVTTTVFTACLIIWLLIFNLDSNN